MALEREPWTEAQRTEANLNGRLVHREQHIDAAGNLEGPAPATDTLRFRWSAVHNLFLTPGDFAADEWRASRAADEDNAEREMRQFVWSIPVAPSKMDQTALEVHELASRISPLPRGVVPKDAQFVTAAIDLGKYLTHWIAVAWSPGATGHVLDYGRIEVPSEDLGVEQALLVALRQFRDLVRDGWPVGDANGERRIADQAWVDAGYMTDVVYTFCREVGERFRPAIDRGAAQQHRQWYNRPTQKGHHVLPGVAAGAPCPRQAPNGRGKDGGIRGRQGRGREMGAYTKAEPLAGYALQRQCRRASLRRAAGG